MQGGAVPCEMVIRTATIIAKNDVKYFKIQECTRKDRQSHCKTSTLHNLHALSVTS